MFHVAVVQAEVTPDLASSLGRGLEQTAALTADAARQGARLAVFPETWLPGYPIWLDVCRDVALWNSPDVKRVFTEYAENSVVINGDSGRALGRIAEANDVTLVIGVTERIDEGPGRGTLYNALLTYGPDGTLLNRHRKLMPTYTERIVWGQGDASQLRAVEIPGARVGGERGDSPRVGGLICWEHWMPLSRQALHESGEDIHVAVWPTVHDMHQVASRHYAFEGRCFVLAAGSLMRGAALPAELAPDPGRVPTPDALVMRGGSAIYAPDGACVAGPVFDTPTTLHAELDLSAVRAESMTLDVAGHYSRPDCFEFRVKNADPS